MSNHSTALRLTVAAIITALSLLGLAEASAPGSIGAVGVDPTHVWCC